MKIAITIKTLLIAMAGLVLPAVCTAPASAQGPASERGQKFMKLVHEAQVEDGKETAWKFYLYGPEFTSTAGDVSYSYGTNQYKGTWETTKIDGHTAYLIHFDAARAGDFNTRSGGSIRLVEAAILDYGDGEGAFMTIPDSERYDCEMLDE